MWEIFAYHNSAGLIGVFNAVAAIMGSDAFSGSLAAVAFCGFLAALCAYAFAPEKLHGWKWLGTVVLAYGALIVPKVTVGVVDKTGGGPVQVVDNVPFGMAVLGSLTSSIGNAMTETFETAFQVIPGPYALPAELNYQHHGMMFGSRVIQETRQATFPDAGVRSDLVNFIGNCTVYDISDGSIDPQTFVTSADLWSLMSDTNPARFTTLTLPTGVTADTCTAAYASINTRMAPAVATLTARLALRLNPNLAPSVANAQFADQVVQAYIRGQIAQASVGAADLVRQNALINAFTDAAEIGCQRINDPSCMMLATGRAAAVASQNAAWINGAKIAEQSLPVVRNAAEALCYAIFPLVVLLVFIGSGRTAVTTLSWYVAVLVSIQLWPPLFAVLNYMASVYGATVQAAAAEVGSGNKALALQTASPIYTNAISGQAVVSYLIIGIPLLSYSLARGMANFGVHLVGGLSGLQSTVGNVSSSAATGSASLGNVSMDQRNVSPVTSDPWVSRMQLSSGDWITSTGTGSQAIEFLRNSGAAANVISTRATSTNVTEASRAAEAARSEALSANRERAAALVDALSHTSTVSKADISTNSASASAVNELGRSADQLSSISEQVGRSTALSSTQVQSIAFQLAAGLGLGLKAEGSAGKNFQGSLSTAEQAVANAISSEQLQQFQRFADRVSHDRGVLSSISTESRGGSELASRLAVTTARSEASQAAYAERQAFADRVSTAYEHGQSISVDLAQLPVNSDLLARYHALVRQYGPTNRQAIQAAFSAEIANYSLHPHRTESGAAVPLSFADVAGQNERNRSSPSLGTEPVTAARSRADEQVHRGPQRVLTDPAAAPTPSQTGEPEGRTIEAEIPSKVRSAIDGFDARNQITRNPDGTTGTSRSLVGGNLKQLRDDVSNLGEEVKRLLDR